MRGGLAPIRVRAVRDHFEAVLKGVYPSDSDAA
jgi:hypothetical protein